MNFDKTEALNTVVGYLNHLVNHELKSDEEAIDIISKDIVGYFEKTYYIEKHTPTTDKGAGE